MNKKHTCCICGKEFEGWGNNPDGAIDPDTLKKINWDSEHVCCDECNYKEVVPSRIAMMMAQRIVKNELEFETSEEGINQLRSLVTEGKIPESTYDFILANWDRLI